MTSPLSPETVQWGCVYTPANVAAGTLYWRLMSAKGPLEWGGRHAIFVEVLDAEGRRAVGEQVVFWNGGEVIKVAEAKPGEAYALDFPMFAANNAYGVRMSSRPSDTLFGMGLVPFEPHVAFQLVFQLVMASGVGEPPGPLPPVEPPAMTPAEAIQRAQNYFALGQQLLDYALGRLSQ